MARNNTRRFSNRPAHRAHLRAGADSWSALASVAVASTLVLALAIGVLALIEAVFSNTASQFAQRSPSQTESQRWHARAQ